MSLLRIHSEEEYKAHGPDCSFWCPACETGHAVWTVLRPNCAHWNFNGNLEKPTFSPSIRLHRSSKPMCHVVVTDGIINYCADCEHSMAGQSVPMVPMPENEF